MLMRHVNCKIVDKRFVYSTNRFGSTYAKPRVLPFGNYTHSSRFTRVEFKSNQLFIWFCEVSRNQNLVDAKSTFKF